jgi:hypothetical protein
MNVDLQTLNPDLPLIFDAVKYFAKEAAYDRKYYDAAYAMRVAAKVARVLASQTDDEGVKEAYLARSEACDAEADYYEAQPVDFI